MRGTYRTQLASIEAAREKQRAPLKDRYLEELTKLQTDTTKAGKLEDALAVKAVIDGMSRLVPAAATPSGVGGKSILARGNGKTDQKAAQAMCEWALANGAVLETDLGKIGINEKLNTVPTKRFRVFAIESRTPSITPFPWAALGGLSEVTSLTVIQAMDCKLGDLANLKTLDRLSFLWLEGPLTNDRILELPTIASVEWLVIMRALEVTSIIAELREKFPLLGHLGLDFVSLDAASAVEISKWQNLHELNCLGPLDVDVAKALNSAPD